MNNKNNSIFYKKKQKIMIFFACKERNKTYEYRKYVCELCSKVHIVTNYELNVICILLISYCQMVYN
jgi:hypothetical protein